ncbi:MAG: ABC-2 transporter permease [Lachnospiraceae bacterium]|nr:ABC-2 transporter permease [Lachnospiraceae bacterium]
MKGLLIKDYYLLKKQGRFLLTVFIIALIVIMLNKQGSSFAVSYLTLTSAFLSLSTISYDEYDNGNSFLFTLPFKRRTYVYEKYLLGFIMGGSVWLLSTVLSFLHDYFITPSLQIMEWWISYSNIMTIFLFFFAIFVPLHLKFGSDKGRVVSAILFGIVFAVFYVVSKIKSAVGIDFKAFLPSLPIQNLGFISGMLFVLSLIALSISIGISQTIIKQKEF